MTRKRNYSEPLMLRAVRAVFPTLEKFAPPLARRFFVRIFFSPVRYDRPEKEKQAMGQANAFWMTAAGERVRVFTWGEAVKGYVMFVHGWAGRGTQFRKFIEPFTKAGWQVLAFDGPAHGESTGSRTTAVQFAEVMQKIADTRGKPRAVIAHSFGGVATLRAIMLGLEVDRVINIASPTLGDLIISTYLNAIGGSAATGEWFKGYIERTTGKPFFEFTSLYTVQHLPRPLQLLLVHDEGDTETPIAHAHALLGVYPAARLHQTKGLGHNRILKDEGVIKECLAFVERDAPEAG
ncbi:MAG: alpha/beta hydrolase [Cyclobacteriaceae bacterium]|jgi:hypothetical protein